MDTPSSLALLLLVVPSLALVRELFLVKQPMSWSNAQSYCRKHHLDLVTVANQDDWTRVHGMVANSGTGGAWIGLYNDSNSWRWSLDNTLLYQDGNTPPGSWFSFTADNANGNEYCVHMVSGQFRDKRCQSGCYIICYDEPSNTYHPIQTVHTWFEAQTICRETYTDLASVRNQAELDTIKAAFNHANHFWWVGLSRANWTWSEQSKSSFRAWAQGQPGSSYKNCTYTDASGWANDNCLTQRPFICSTPVTKVIKVGLKIDEPTDPNDHHILAALLKQRETLLREQGIDQEFNLKWRMDPRGVVFNKTEL